MKRLLTFFLALLMAVLPLAALAAGKLSVAQETFTVLPYLDYHAGFIFAELQNTGDKPVAFNDALLELYDKEGNAIASNNYLNAYPEVLEPGETGYLFGYQTVTDAATPDFIDDHLLTVTGRGSIDQQKIALKTADARFETGDDPYWVEHLLLATVINETGETLYDVNVVFAVKDAEGKLMYAAAYLPYNVGLPAGSSLELRVGVDAEAVKDWEAKGQAPAAVEAIAYTLTE